MNATISPLSVRDWVPLGIELRSPARRNPSDRGKRSVVELGAPAGGGQRAVVQRDGHYRPADGSAEFLTFWIATAKGWCQVSSYEWSSESRTWESVERAGPRPT